MQYTTVIFDVGDTLLESYPSEIEMYSCRLSEMGFTITEQIRYNIEENIVKVKNEQILKEEHGQPRMPDADFSGMVDMAALECVLLGKDDDTKRFYQAEMRRKEFPEQTLRIIPDTIETLEILLSKRYRLAIVSNHKKWLPDYLKKLGIAAFFESIIVSDIVGYEKPDPRIMELAINSMCVKAKDCLYVGDHPFDVLCSKKAGIDCAWLTSKDSVLPTEISFQEDYRIQRLPELLHIL